MANYEQYYQETVEELTQYIKENKSIIRVFIWNEIFRLMQRHIQKLQKRKNTLEKAL